MGACGQYHNTIPLPFLHLLDGYLFDLFDLIFFHFDNNFFKKKFLKFLQFEARKNKLPSNLFWHYLGCTAPPSFRGYIYNQLLMSNKISTTLGIVSSS